jgi:hypothetical protein
MTRFSRRPIHSSVRRACWVGAGTELAAGCQASKVLPVGNSAAARRVAREDRARAAASSTSNARSTSAGSTVGPWPWPARRGRGGGCADGGQPQPAQQRLQVGGQRRRGWDPDGRRRLRGPGGLGRRSSSRSRGDLELRAGGTGQGRPHFGALGQAAVLTRLVHHPAAGAGVVGQDRGEVALAEAGVDGSVPERPVHRDRVGETAAAILTRIRPAPAAAASTSHKPGAVTEGQEIDLCLVFSASGRVPPHLPVRAGNGRPRSAENRVRHGDGGRPRPVLRRNAPTAFHIIRD